MRPVKLYAKPYYGEHPVPPPYRIWQHRAWIDASGVVVAEEVDAGDSAVASPYPGEIRGSVLGLKPAQLVKLGFQEIADPLYVTMRAEFAEEAPDEVKPEPNVTDWVAATIAEGLWNHLNIRFLAFYSPASSTDDDLYATALAGVRALLKRVERDESRSYIIASAREAIRRLSAPPESILEMPKISNGGQQMAVVIRVLREVVLMLYNHEVIPARAEELIELLDTLRPDSADHKSTRPTQSTANALSLLSGFFGRLMEDGIEQDDRTYAVGQVLHKRSGEQFGVVFSDPLVVELVNTDSDSAEHARHIMARADVGGYLEYGPSGMPIQKRALDEGWTIENWRAALMSYVNPLEDRDP